MKPGDVFLWKDFPYPNKGGDIKPRWFIYLGNAGIFETPIFAYICTTTTQIDDFQKGGKREKHRHFLFRKGDYPFEEQCILDYDELPYINIKKEEIEGTSAIEVRGTLDARTMRVIYEGIYSSRLYSPRVKRDIRDSLNMIGITGLKKI